MFLIYWSYDHYTNQNTRDAFVYLPSRRYSCFVVCSRHVILKNSMEVAKEMLLFLFSCSRKVTLEACH
jgi:hypothetical protein